MGARAAAVSGTATAVMITALLGLVAPATAQAQVRCERVGAVGTGQARADGTTVATIRGDRRLAGTTEGAFVPAGAPQGTVLPITGAVDFTTATGTLATTVDGTFDIASGIFSVRTSSLTGGGGLDGATGRLTFLGYQNPEGRFAEVVTGTLCTAR